MADSHPLDVEKVASLWLIHASENGQLSLDNSPALVKIASDLIEEENMALHYGVELVLEAILDGEVK